MFKKPTVIITAIVILSLLIVSCASPTLTPAVTTEPEIPAHFTTYTSEGLFSISYPPDWVPATSIMEELSEQIKEWMKSVDPTVEVEETQLLFLAGVPIEEGYYPSISVGVTTRTAGYWTLDEIDEADSLWSRENIVGYRENSRIKTMVDGRESSILDSEDDEPSYGRWRYLSLTTVKGDFVWVVTCCSEYIDFNDWEGIFNSIIRSLRILN